MTIRSDPDQRPDGKHCPFCGRVMHYQTCVEGVCAQWVTEARQIQREDWQKYREKNYADEYSSIRA